MRLLDRGNTEDIYSLTPMQEGILFHYLEDPQNDAYFEQLHLTISGEIERTVLNSAWNAVIRTNEMLRAIFRWEEVKEPVQIILKKVNFKYRYYDLEQSGMALEEIRSQDRQEKFDLRKIPFRVTLCKLTKNSYEMIVSHHHILYDGWSTNIVLSEFFRAYSDLAAKKEPARVKKTGFGVFVRRLKEWKIREWKESKSFWKAYLQGFEGRKPMLLAPYKRQVDTRSQNIEVPCSPCLKEKIASCVRSLKISMASLFYGAWGIILQKYCHSQEAVFGSTVAGRSLKIKGIEDIVGLFINTIPLRVITGAASETADLIQEIDNTLKVRQKYEASALVDIAAHAELAMPHQLFDTIVVVENYPIDRHLGLARGKDRGLRLEGYKTVEMIHYDLGLGIEIDREGNIKFKFAYRSDSFAQGIIDRLAGHFIRAIENMVSQPKRKIVMIDILSAEERRQILIDFNGETINIPEDSAVHRIVESRVLKGADHTAVVGMWTSEELMSRKRAGEHHLTYRLLNDRALRVADQLRRRGIGVDDIVAIRMERRPESIIGILAIMHAHCAYLPIDMESPRERVEYMLTDSGASFILMAEHILGSGIRDVDFLSSEISASRNGLAYCIYTSGSTGRPKGVMVAHRALGNFVYSLYHCFGENFNAQDRGLCITSLAFDVSVCEIFMPLVFGACLILLPDQKVYNISSLANTLTAESITFAYIHPPLLTEVCDCLQNSGHRVALNKLLVGVEPIKDQVLAAYLNLNSDLRIVNGYGPTEATICATFFPFKSKTVCGENVPIGRPLANTRILLMDRQHNPVPVAVAGELYISGCGLAEGYLNNPELTDEKFFIHKVMFPKSEISCPSEQNRFVVGREKSPPGTEALKLYKTGDLCCWLKDGNIRFLGRIDHQVKIRGFRIELGEIENQLNRHPLVKQAVVVARSDPSSDKFLIAYIVFNSPPSTRISEKNNDKSLINQMREYLALFLPLYMIPSYFVCLDKIPLTQNGKTDRDALPEPQLQTGAEGKIYTAPRSELEERLVNLWAEVLGLPSSAIGIDNQFFNLGGHSLKAMHLISRIHKAFDVRVPLPEFFRVPTVRELSEYISQAADDPYCAIIPAEKREYYRVSSAQRRLYILHQVDDQTTRYNLTGAMRIEGNLERNSLEEIFGRLIGRHESLRSGFEVYSLVPVQKIHDRVDFEIDYYDEHMTGLNRVTGNVVDDFFRPFDLSRPPLLRVGLVRETEQRYLLLVNMHHIISDEASMVLLEREFRTLYAGKALPGLKLQYKDFSEWQNRMSDSSFMMKQERFWLNLFRGEIPVLDLPLDFPRPAIIRAEGSRISFELGAKLTTAIKKMTVETETTTFTFLLAVYNVLLARYSGQVDIVVGSPVEGRLHLDLRSIVGLFVNMLPLRNYPCREKTFNAFLMEVKQNVLQAFENQEYSFEKLVWNLKLKVDPSRNPLFDVVLVLRNRTDGEGRVIREKGQGIIDMKHHEVPKKKIHNELILEIDEGRHPVSMILEYSTELFKAATARKMLHHFEEILTQVLENPGIRLGDIRISTGLLAVQPHQQYTSPDENRDFRF